MDKILFILNPIAGGGKSRDLISIIMETMDKCNREYTIIPTTKPEHAITVVEENIEYYDIFVAVGGDGTVNEVARGLINKGKGTLGIIPGGTGNDMAKSLGVPLNPKEALESLCRGLKREIDIGNVNGFNFLNIASVGFDAEVVINNVRIKKIIKSRISYAISVIYTLLSFKKKKIKVKIDGQVLEEEIILLAVGNGRYYGGGMEILPMAIVDDGFIDICLISGLGKIKILFLFPSIFKGNHIKYNKYVKTYKAKSVQVNIEEGIYLNIDGDVLPKQKEIKFNLENKKLNVIFEEK